MTEELEQQLFDKFFFYRPELSETVSLMCYGFECDDGWFDLIWNMSLEIEKALTPDDISEYAKELLLDNNKFNISQVKCKLGELRVYPDYSFKEVDDIISKYEEIAGKTCERCGKDAIYRQGRRTVLCDDCMEEYLNKVAK